MLIPITAYTCAARGMRVYISGRTRVHVLQLLNVYYLLFWQVHYSKSSRDKSYCVYKVQTQTTLYVRDVPSGWHQPRLRETNQD